MHPRVPARLTAAAVLLAVILMIVTGTTIVGQWEGHASSALLRVLAQAVVIGTAGLMLAFVIVQALPGGREVVRIKGTTRSDSWLFVLAATLLPGVYWSDLERLSGVHTLHFPIILSSLLIAGRLYQLRMRTSSREVVQRIAP